MQEVKIQDLTDRCLKYFKDNCYTENRISTYKSLWRTGIIRYMNEHGIESYSLSVGADFVSTCHYQGEVRHQEREKIRSVQVLDDMLQLGHIRKVRVTPVHHPLDGDIGKDMEKLISHLTNLRRSKTTINDYAYISASFSSILTHQV